MINRKLDRFQRNAKSPSSILLLRFFEVETQFAGKCSMPETISVFVPDKMVTDATSTSMASASAADLDFG